MKCCGLRVGLVVALVLQSGVGTLAFQTGRDDKEDKDKKEEKIITTDSGLQYVDLKEGLGDPARGNDEVTVHYTGWFTNGKEFDSSRERKAPLTFVIGKGGVVKGLEEGAIGMKPGAKRKLMIPSKLGYGPAGYREIPPNADLIFEVEMLKVKSEN